LEAAETESMKTTLLRRLHTGQRRYAALRMAPMIDVIFLLLIFFLVAAKWRPQEDFLPFQLAGAQVQLEGRIKPEPLIIQISPTGAGCEVRIGRLHTVRIENEKIESDLAALMAEMAECLLAEKRFAADPVEIICEPGVRWEHVARIYNVFYGAGLTDITFRMTE